MNSFPEKKECPIEANNLNYEKFWRLIEELQADAYKAKDAGLPLPMFEFKTGGEWIDASFDSLVESRSEPGTHKILLYLGGIKHCGQGVRLRGFTDMRRSTKVLK